MEPSNCSQHFKSFIFPFDISADKFRAKTDESAGHLKFLLLSKFNNSRRKELYRHIIIYRKDKMSTLSHSFIRFFSLQWLYT